MIRNALGIAPAGFVCVSCTMDATLTLLHFVFPILHCCSCSKNFVPAACCQRVRMNIAQDIFCVNRKFIFFQKFFIFFRFFSGEGKRGIRAGILLDDRGKAPGGMPSGWTGPPHGLWRPATQPWSGGGRAASRERSGRPRVTEQRKGGSQIDLRIILG